MLSKNNDCNGGATKLIACLVYWRLEEAKTQKTSLRFGCCPVQRSSCHCSAGVDVLNAILCRKNCYLRLKNNWRWDTSYRSWMTISQANDHDFHFSRELTGMNVFWTKFELLATFLVISFPLLKQWSSRTWGKLVTEHHSSIWSHVSLLQ